jgi:hypothetical protein
MTRSKSRRTRRNRRRGGGHSRGFAGEEGWITAENHLTDLTTPGGCAMMLGKRIGLIARSGFGGEYGKIADGTMKGYDGETENKVAMMKFNLGCDRGNGEKQVKKVWYRLNDLGKDALIKNGRYGDPGKTKIIDAFKALSWNNRKAFLEATVSKIDSKGNTIDGLEKLFEGFAVSAKGAEEDEEKKKNRHITDLFGQYNVWDLKAYRDKQHAEEAAAAAGGRRRKKSRKKRRKSRRKSRRNRKKSRKRRRRR